MITKIKAAYVVGFDGVKTIQFSMLENITKKRWTGQRIWVTRL